MDLSQPHGYFYHHILSNDLLEDIKANPDYSVIDVCCLLPQYLFHIYSKIGKKRYVGLEGWREDRIAQFRIKDLLRLEQNQVVDKVYDFYSAFPSLVKPRYFEDYPLLSKKEFFETFDLRFGVDVEKEVKKFDSEFDYLILNNVIHLPHDSERFKLDIDFITDCFKIVKKGGFIWVKVNHENKFSLLYLGKNNNFQFLIKLDRLYLKNMMHVIRWNDFHQTCCN